MINSDKNGSNVNTHAINEEILLKSFSIEVMPRTAKKLDNLENLIPPKTTIYIAHLDGVEIEEMRKTAHRLATAGYTVVPHFPARIIQSAQILDDWVKRYADLGVYQGLVIAGGLSSPIGDFSNSMQLLETETFDKYGFNKIYVAGHPEGNKDIEIKGSDQNIMDALRWKQDFSERTDAEISITTQFCFESPPVIQWAEKLSESGINFPINIGIAGPAKLQTMIKFAFECGVGASIRVLERRAKDLSKLLLPYTPEKVLRELSEYKSINPTSNIVSAHFFPLGGIKKTIEFVNNYRNVS